METGELNIRRVRSVCGGYNKGEENIYSNVLSVGLAEPCYFADLSRKNRKLKIGNWKRDFANSAFVILFRERTLDCDSARRRYEMN